MRLLHTSDWHLGHTLHDLPREYEHRRFLAWLHATIAEQEVDALIIAGDIFDSANPPAAAQSTWYRFLAETRRRFKSLAMVAIGGNHDSAARLDAPAPLLRELGVHVVGGLPRDGGGAIECDRLLVPLCDRQGKVAAWLAAVPFLRPADLEADARRPEGDPLVEGVRRVYDQVLDAARRRRRKGEALIATGHCYMVGGQLSALSERKVLGGNQHALPVEIFAADVSYVALGHLHLAQAVGGRAWVRYSGAPIPLALPERHYAHQVAIVDCDGERRPEVRTLLVPRATEILSLPDTPQPLDRVLPLLAALPPRATGSAGATGVRAVADMAGVAGVADPAGGADPAGVAGGSAVADPADADDALEGARPFLEVKVLLERPEPSLRRRLEEALEGKAARLVKVSLSHGGTGASLAEAMGGERLVDLDPEAVFARRYLREHQPPVPEDLLQAFHELLDAVRQAPP